jgi:hypothetical protein
MAVVVIRVRVGKLVVVAMETGPGDRPLLAAQGTAGGEKSFQPFGNPKRPVRQQSVVTDRDSEAGCSPVQNAEGENGLPAPETRQ